MTIRMVIPLKLEYNHDNIKDLGDYTNRQLATIQRRFDNGVPYMQLNVANVPPPKPRIGMKVYADGFHWNPGSGEGLYIFKSTGWKFIG